MKQFTETQHFRQIWIWFVLLFTAGFELSMLRQLMQHNTLHSLRVTDILGVVIPLLLIVFFLTAKLETRVDSTGIAVKFFPLHLSWKKYSWGDIARAYTRIYNPLGEYGGWGIRRSFGNGKAYNVSGNQGLQLELKTGKKLMIGTQKSGELQQLLDEFAGKGIIVQEHNNDVKPHAHRDRF